MTEVVATPGVVAQFQLINPHPFLLVDVTESAGRAQRWRLEMDNRSGLWRSAFRHDLEAWRSCCRQGKPRQTQPQARTYSGRSPGRWILHEQVGNSPRIRPREEAVPRYIGLVLF
jgi:hypothetical protein